MEFDFMLTESSNYLWLVGSIIVGIIIMIILDNIEKFDRSKQKVFVNVFILAVTVVVGIALSFNTGEKVDQEKTLAQIENLDLTIVDVGDNIFRSMSNYNDEEVTPPFSIFVENNEYDADHKLSLRAEDSTTYDCLVTVPANNSKNIFFVDCFQPGSDSLERVPLNKVLETS